MNYEKDSLLKKLAKTGLTALGITAATAPGIAALNQAAQNASSEHSTPVSPQEDPFKQQPPPGVTFPEGFRADAPVPDAPVEPVFSHKLFLPTAPNKAVETLTPEQRVERFIATTQVIDRVERVRNNKTYSVETRITPQAAHQAVVKEELKDRVAQLVAKDGEKNGFTKAQVVILKPEDQLPEGISLRGSSVNIGPDQNGQPQWVRMGSYASQRIENRSILYFAPDPNLPRDNPTVMMWTNRWLTDSLFRLTITGNHSGVNVAAAYRENPEYRNLIDQEALSITFL